MGDRRPGLRIQRLRGELAHELGSGAVEWLPGYGDDVVALRNRSVIVIANLGAEPVALPEGALLLASNPLEGGMVPTDTTVWIATD